MFSASPYSGHYAPENSMSAKVVAAAAFATSMGISAAFADYVDLPATAKPMPAADIQKAYSGKTLTGPGGQVYWVPDGTAIGYSRMLNVFGDGTWEVTDGKICYHITWQGVKSGDVPYTVNNCYGYMVDDKKIYYHYTTDKSSNSVKGWSYGQDDLSKLAPGNTILDAYTALKAKMPTSP
jgi:hypothetical protein